METILTVMIPTKENKIRKNLFVCRELAHILSSSSRYHEPVSSLKTLLNPFLDKFQGAGPNHLPVKSFTEFVVKKWLSFVSPRRDKELNPLHVKRSYLIGRNAYLS